MADWLSGEFVNPIVAGGPFGLADNAQARANSLAAQAAEKKAQQDRLQANQQHWRDRSESARNSNTIAPAMDQANQARGQQVQALDLQRQAAMGQMPSQAQAMQQNQLDRGIQAQMSAANSARGGQLARAGAQSQALQQGAITQAQGANDIAALRAQEMAAARGQYMQGSDALRGSDYSGGQLALQQQQVNQAGALGYGQLEAGQGQQALGAQQLQQNQEQFNAEQAAKANQFNVNTTKDVVGKYVDTLGNIMSMGMKSDMRLKEAIHPLALNPAVPDRSHPMGDPPPYVPEMAYPNRTLVSDLNLKDDVVPLGTLSPLNNMHVGAHNGPPPPKDYLYSKGGELMRAKQILGFPQGRG